MGASNLNMSIEKQIWAERWRHFISEFGLSWPRASKCLCAPLVGKPRSFNGKQIRPHLFSDNKIRRHSRNQLDKHKKCTFLCKNLTVSKLIISRNKTCVTFKVD